MLIGDIEDSEKPLILLLCVRYCQACSGRGVCVCARACVEVCGREGATELEGSKEGKRLKFT